MNSIQIYKMCKEIYRDYTSMGRKANENDQLILAVIMREYNIDPYINWEEVKWLWIKYLETGNLYFAEARQMAEDRIAWEDIKATEEELIHWLHGGI